MAHKKNHHTPRDKPPYHEDTFKSEKVKKAIKYVLSRNGWIIEFEGGKRGSKDVIGIYAWSQYLMLTPDKEHLVLGKTLEHAIVTVLKSQGFGLYYCIPSGEFTRETISGGQTRGVFKFTDAYGMEKIVYFYGNEKAQDYSKFKGFSLGSVYINEANEQHPQGIKEAKERTNASLWPRIIVTQNPKSGAHIFYTEFEEPLIYGEEENFLIKNIKNRFGDMFLEKKEEMLEQMEKERKELVRSFLHYRDVPKAKLLPKKEYSKLMRKVRDLKEKWNKTIRNVKVNDLTDEYNDNTNPLFVKIQMASMELIMEYEPYFENRNEVQNGLEFAYFHFTHDDNPAMSDADRGRIDRTYDTKSPSYLRDIRGERATVDNAIWPTFDEDNVYDYEVPIDAIKGRFFGIDLGYDHPFAVTEGLILHDDTLLIHDELFIRPHEVKEKANNVEYIKELKKFINKRYDGDYDGVTVDPSAKGFINQCITGGIVAFKAKNRVKNYNPEDTTESDHTQDRKVVGINLVREGFRLKRIKVHKRCTMTRKQISGYSFDPKKLELGVEAPLKINDDLPDTIRYLVNTIIGYVAKWSEGSETLSYVEKRQEEVLGSEVPEKRKEDNSSQEEADKFQQKIVQDIIQSFRGNGRDGNNSGYLF